MGPGKFYYHDMINDHVQWDPPTIGIVSIVDKLTSVIVFKIVHLFYMLRFIYLKMYNLNGL